MTILEMYMAQGSTTSTQLDQCFCPLLEIQLGIQSWDMQSKLINLKVRIATAVGNQQPVKPEIVSATLIQQLPCA